MEKMKIFKNKQKSNEEIIDKLEDLEVKIDELKIKTETSNSNREKTLEEMAFNAKHERIKEYEDRIKSIKAESECKDVVIDQQQKDIEKYKKDLEENELLLRAANNKNKKLEKELKELKDKGMVLPKRVRKTGVTKDTKQVVGIKPSKVSSAAKTELKKINELREKEAV